jgi:hypothetical protein
LIQDQLDAANERGRLAAANAREQKLREAEEAAAQVQAVQAAQAKARVLCARATLDALEARRQRWAAARPQATDPPSDPAQIAALCAVRVRLPQGRVVAFDTAAFSPLARVFSLVETQSAVLNHPDEPYSAGGNNNLDTTFEEKRLLERFPILVLDGSARFEERGSGSGDALCSQRGVAECKEESEGLVLPREAQGLVQFYRWAWMLRSVVFLSVF